MKHIQLSTAKDLHIFLNDFYDEIVYDGSPEFKDYIPKGIWITLFQEKDVAGFINLEPLNNVTWIAHVMIYEKFRGKGSEEWGKQAAQYMIDVHGAKKFLAFTPYESAKRYAERMGFKQIAILDNSILKDGKLLSQYILELGEMQ